MKVEPTNSSTDEERMKILEKDFGAWANNEEEYSTEQFIEEINAMCAGKDFVETAQIFN